MGELQLALWVAEGTGVRMQDEIVRSVEQFLYREARLLDSRQFDQWLDLFAEDVRYWMPTRTIRYPSISKAISIQDKSRYREDGLSKENELSIMEETKETLTQRVNRLGTGMAWAEDPPSLTRHIISNIEVEEGESDSEVMVYSNYVVYRNRAGSEQDFYVGGREDVLRGVDGDWKIARRKVLLDQNVLLAKNVSIFF